MGHLINPISLRLGHSQVWRSQWYKATNRDYIVTLKEDIMLYNYIESFFKYAKLKKKKANAIVKLTNKAKTKLQNKFRLLRPSQRKRIRVKRYVNSQVVEKLSLIFSHANVLRFGSHLILNIHLYDGAFETFKAKQQNDAFDFSQSEKNSFYKMLAAKRNKKNIQKRHLNKKVSRKILASHNHLTPREYLRSFFNTYYVKKAKPINILTDFLKKQNFKYTPQIVKTDLSNLTKVQQIKKNLNKSYFKKKEVLLLRRKSVDLSFLSNLKLRFINTRLRYITKGLHNFFLKKQKLGNLKIKSIKKQLHYYFKLVKLLSLIHMKSQYKEKIKKTFLLRVLLFSLLKLRFIMSKYVKFIQSSRKSSLKRNKKKTKVKNNFQNRKKLSFVTKLAVIFSGKKKNEMENLRHKKISRNIKLINNNLERFKRNNIRLNNFILYILCLTSQYNFEDRRLQLYKLRYTTWFYISRVIFENIKTLVKSNSYGYSKIQLSYFGLTNSTPTASMLAYYLSTKLYQKYTIFELLRPLSTDLSKNFTIDGFKISCAGRLTKKQRASLLVQKSKKVPANTFDSVIDYATSLVRLRHGVCGLKIWITRKKTYQYFDYNFNYNYKI